MKSIPLRKPVSLLLTLALGLVCLAPIADATPRDRLAKAKPLQAGTAQRHIDRQRGEGSQTVEINGTTADGRTWERRIDTVKTEDGYSRTMTGTTADGQTFNRTTTATHDADAGTWAKETVGTTPAGKSFGTSISGERNADGGYTRTATHTAPDGSVAARTTVVTRNDDGTLSKDVTRTVTPAAPPTQNAEDAGSTGE